MSSPERPPDSEAGPELLNRQRAVRVPARELSVFFEQLQRDVAGGRNFTVVLATDSALRTHNRRYRRKDSPTDVLSFPGGVGVPPAHFLGDILISAQTARRQARRLGHDVETEIKVLAIHGLLHLLGYDHHSAADLSRMARAERRWRRHFGLPLGLIERTNDSGSL